jgi:hypothetical protein
MLGQEIPLPAWMTPEQVTAAQEAAAAVAIDADTTLAYASDAQSYPLINVDDYTANPSYSRFDGTGYSIAILDTGADLDNSAFGPDLNSDGIADRIVYNWDYANNDNNASDDNGHGTNVAGISAGLATGANLIILKVLDNTGSGSFANIESALQWVGQN